MLQTENEYETPIESNNYQKNENHFQNSDNIKKNSRLYWTRAERKFMHKQYISGYIK